MIEGVKLYIWYQLDDLDFHSRSQLYERSKTPVSIFSEISLFDLNKILYVARLCWFVEAHARFILDK